MQFGDAEDQHQDFDHGEVDPAEHDAVDGNSEVEGSEAAEKGRGCAGVADFRELDVGHYTGTPPETGVKKDSEHAAGDEVPPEPVAGDAASGDHAGDGERRVGGEGSGDHGGAGEPPGDVSAGEEEFADAGAGAGFVVKADADIEGEVERDDKPI